MQLDLFALTEIHVWACLQLSALKKENHNFILFYITFYFINIILISYVIFIYEHYDFNRSMTQSSQF